MVGEQGPEIVTLPPGANAWLITITAEAEVIPGPREPEPESEEDE